MIRGFHLADFFTLANAACGVGAVFLTMLYLQSGAGAHFYAAAAMTPLAFFFDWLDGNVARWRHQHSALGRELDSLADVISFGVAPAVLAFGSGRAASEKTSTVALAPRPLEFHSLSVLFIARAA
jgi:CDP-diacylglycerol--serine O-phosphatidyltransferase